MATVPAVEAQLRQLRDKYQQPGASDLDNFVKRQAAQSDESRRLGQTASRSGYASEKLDALMICQRCNGHGTISEVQENFISITRDCPECDGDGVKARRPRAGKAAIATAGGAAAGVAKPAVEPPPLE